MISGVFVEAFICRQHVQERHKLYVLHWTFTGEQTLHWTSCRNTTLMIVGTLVGAMDQCHPNSHYRIMKARSMAKHVNPKLMQSFFVLASNSRMQLQFLAPVEYFSAVKELQFLQFSRAWFVMSALFFKKGTLDHCRRSKAWNSTHHGRYPFQTAFFFFREK